jgi:hypothetical protein
VWLPGAAEKVVPRFAAITQLAKVPFGMAMRAAASSSVRPWAKANLTASSRSSGVYVLVRFINSPVGEVYQTGVSEKVSVPHSFARQPADRPIYLRSKSDHLSLLIIFSFLH